MTRDELRAALKHPNVQAFLRVIREGESSQDDGAYRMLYGGGYFASLDAHPRTKITAAGITSTAAGAYQFLEKTWDGLVKMYGFPDFSPQSQDEAAVALIAGRKALTALMDGDLASTLDRCSWEWASLPPPRYGQGFMSAEKVYATYDRYGGNYGHDISRESGSANAGTPPPVLSSEPPTLVRFPTHQQEKTMAPFIGLAFSVLADLVPTLIRRFGTEGSKNTEANAKLAETVVGVAKQAIGATNEQQLVEMVQADPSLVQTIDKAIQANWFQIQEVHEKSVGAAREFAMAYNAQKDVRTVFLNLTFIEILALLMVLLSALGAGYVLVANFSADLKATVVTMIVVGGFVGIKEFFYGSSRDSQRKTDFLMEEKKGDGQT